MTQSLVPLEGFSDSDEVFPKEMTKWNSNDFIDAFVSPTEAEGVPGKAPESDCQQPICSGDSESNSVLSLVGSWRGCSFNTRVNDERVTGGGGMAGVYWRCRRDTENGGINLESRQISHGG